MTSLEPSAAVLAESTADVAAIAAISAAPRAERIRRLLRYTGVNLVTVTVDYAIFLGLMHVYDAPTRASIVAYAVALMLNYALSKRYVFAAVLSHKSDNRLMAEFIATGIFGLVLTAAITGFSVHVLDLAPALAKTAAVLICFLTLYIIRSRLVFTVKK